METLIIAIAGGVIFQIIHFPLPWMLGPLTTVMIMAFSF
jgi:uncharacterized membrane protein AbrB (regulator of aidB expression)